MIRVLTMRRGLPELLAGALAVLTYCLGQVLSRRFPFGPDTRSVNDYATQLVPQYAHLRDVLTGQATGDLWFNWQSALGVPYLGDVGVYMSSPLSLLVVVFPRDQIDLAAFVIHVLHLALAAAAMTWYLRWIGDGSRLVASALGAAYAVCGWAVDDAGYLTIWLPGLIAFPLMALAGEWAIRSQRVVLAPLLVALPWYANFYTAYMATIGAGLLVLCRLLVLGWSRRDTARAAVRVAWTFGLGVLLSAPLLVPVWAANNLAQPSGSADLERADLTRFLGASPGDTLSRLLPATEGVGLTPGLFVTTPVLLLALTLPWNRRLPARARVLYPATVLAIVATMFWVPTHMAWHGFDLPDGSPYRQAFVLCGLLTVMAWVSIGRDLPDVVAWGGGLVLLALVWVLGNGSEYTSRWTNPLFVIVLVVIAGVVVLTGNRRQAAVVLGAAMCLVVVAEGSVTALVVAEAHDRFAKRPPWIPLLQSVRDEALAVDAWPQTRTTVGAVSTPGSTIRSSPNDAMLIGGESTGYYSSLMSRTTTRALQAVGVPWSGFSRSIFDTPDPARDAVLGIGQRVVTTASGGVHVERRAAAPLVSARPLPEARDNPFRTRNSLSGTQAYTVPPTEVLSPEGEPLPLKRQGGYRPRAAGDRPAAVLRATCPAGTTVQLTAPDMAGWVQLDDDRVATILTPGAREPGFVSSGGPVDLGPAPAGEFRVDVYGGPVVVLPSEPLACFDAQALDAGIRQLQESAAVVTAGGHSFTARWDEPVEGDALALVTAVWGWRCSTGGAWERPQSAAGFIAVDMAGSSELTCSFRPPGVPQGAAIGLLALAALLVTRSTGFGAAPIGRSKQRF